MKRLLLPLLAALALPSTVNANVDKKVHKLCSGVTDYKGCVQLNSKESAVPGCDEFFAKSRKSGSGECVHSDGSRYIVEYRNGLLDGTGTLFGANGGKYSGGLKKGRAHGQGTFLFAGVTKYVSDWVKGKRIGQGTLFWPDGEKYIGDWEND